MPLLPNKRARIAYLLSCLLLVILLLILLPRLNIAEGGLEQISRSNPLLFAGATFAMFGTYICASFALGLLSLRALSFRQTLLVQLASGFTTKLAPAGLGGLALNVRYLQKCRHTFLQASMVLTLNGILGFMGLLVIIVLGVLFNYPAYKSALSSDVWSLFLWIILVVSTTAVLVIVLLPALRVSIIKNIRGIMKIVRIYRQRKSKIFLGLLASLGVTTCFVVVLYMSLKSAGIHLSFLELLFVYVASTIGTAIVPTPGGIGGAEAAITGALVVIGFSTPEALSGALLYRFIVYWVPIVPGMLFFQVCLRRKII